MSSTTIFLDNYMPGGAGDFMLAAVIIMTMLLLLVIYLAVTRDHDWR
ncbi:MAG TPA: hypothetical protein PKK85_08385 [Methanobacteriaceae archaeon]|nr:hypothetical protein [Methanobacteriaceae archaeon]